MQNPQESTFINSMTTSSRMLKVFANLNILSESANVGYRAHVIHIVTIPNTFIYTLFNLNLLDKSVTYMSNITNRQKIHGWFSHLDSGAI